MGAPKGNQFWKARSSHGRTPTFASPDDLWDACVEYFEWVDANPLYEDKLTSYQGVNQHEPVAKMRAMTISGLCIFLDIDLQTWANYRANKDFFGVVSRVELTIRTQKFEGASADLLNANIIARELGLADKSELSGPDGGPIHTESTSDRDLAKAVALLLAKGMNADG
ncbi:DNA-packaging protein [Rhizobium sp. AG207R]|uniref:DNA-packaging protein n=1 Tax=Rhizobium sp. AG207R TaxID=2802287 RepID=UPI0022AC0F6B|nr:DNA-packaging protein [Rhizobium sp. AG207R]MCZ3377435.1 DNA-packaging protein [Rhizobium sp. AG207R]